MVDKSLGIRVLFTGQYWPGANTVYIAKAFERCGVILNLMNDTTIWPGWSDIKSRALRRLLLPLIESEWNHQLVKLVDNFLPDLVYITNAHFCWKKTLEYIHGKSIPVMCFYHDVPWKDRILSRFSDNLSLFNLIATTRSWHVDQFKKAGAKDVMVVRFGFDPDVHHPVRINQKVIDYYGTDITFIGTSHNQRRSDLNKLLDSDFPFSMKIWGNSWDKYSTYSRIASHWQGRSVNEQEIPIIYASSKIALHWVHWEPSGSDPMLRKGDQHNSRTFQIAACGGAMMIAQRTDEHLALFAEDIEAVYFSDVNELRDKIYYWLAPQKEPARLKIAWNSRKRCIKEDYSYLPVVRKYLEYFDLL